MKLKFALKKLDHDDLLQNFQILQDAFRNQKLLQDWAFFDLTFNVAVTDEMFRHNLGYIPKDVLVTRLSGPGTLTFEYDKFTSEFIKITTTGACRVRCFVGTYREE